MTNQTTPPVSSATKPPALLTAATAYTPLERRLVLLFAIVGALIESMELNLLSYPLGDLASTFHVTKQAVVATITLQSLASIAGGFVFGWMADRWGRRPTYVVFTATYSLLAIAGAMAPNFDVFTITRIGAGLAMGGAFGVIFAMFSESWKSPKRGLMGSVLQGMFIAGTLITQLILFVTISSLGSEPGWRMGFTVIGILCLVIAAAAWFWLPESKLWRAALDAKRKGILTPHVEESRQDSNPRPRRLVTGAIFLTICTTGVFAASYSYITFAPTFLRETLGTNLGVSTIVLTVGTLLGIASYMVFGALSDHIGRRKATLWACVLGIVGFGAFALLGDGSPTVAIVALMGTAVGYAGFGVLGTWISEFYPTRFRAFGSGATYYVARGLGSGLYPLFALWLAGGDLRLALSLGGFGAVLGLLGCIFVPDTANKIITAQE
jgi:MFS family permease